MFDPEFFPTPPPVAMRMWSALGNCSVVLEPSAGKGDLIDWVKKDAEYRHWNVPRIDAIEPNSELRMILKGKGYNVVHDDFLTFSPSRKYDGIIMNPPFSSGISHLLRAWSVLHSGKIVCLLPMTTLRTKHTARHDHFLRLIEEHGEIVELGASFTDAERSTRVEIGMVVLTKEASNTEFGFFDEMAEEKAAHTFGVDGSDEVNIAKTDVVDTLVGMYRNALQAHQEFLRAKNRVLFYTKNLAPGIDQEDLLSNRHESDNNQFNDFVDKLCENCWDLVFEKTDIRRYVTNGVREEFEKFRTGNKRIDFTRQNIEEMVRTLGASASTIVEEALLKVFDELTRYDEKNRVHIEGWKTNDAWRVNRKVIIPNVVEKGWSGEPGFSYWGRREVLDDIDRVMCALTGKDFTDIVTLQEALTTAFGVGWGKVAESEFFTIKFYKKGTVHLFFKDERVWADFNQAAAKGKNWLPGDRV